LAAVDGLGALMVRLDDSFVIANTGSTGGGLYVEGWGVRLRSVCSTVVLLPVDRFCTEVAENLATAIDGASAIEVDATGAGAVPGWVELGRASVRDNALVGGILGSAVTVRGASASLLAQNVLFEGNGASDSIVTKSGRLSAYHATFGDSGAVRMDATSVGQINASLFSDLGGGGLGLVVPTGVATGSCNAGVGATSIAGPLNQNIPIAYAGAAGLRSWFDLLPVVNGAFDRCPTGLAIDIGALGRPKYAAYDRGAFEAP
jgi:hypothetical protein